MRKKFVSIALSLLSTVVVVLGTKMSTMAAIADYWTPDMKGSSHTVEDNNEELSNRETKYRFFTYKEYERLFYDSDHRLLFQLSENRGPICQVHLYTENGSVTIKEAWTKELGENEKYDFSCIVTMLNERDQVLQEESYDLTESGLKNRDILFYEYNEDGTECYRSDGSSFKYDETGNKLLEKATFGSIGYEDSERTEFKLKYNEMQSVISDSISHSFTVYANGKEIATVKSYGQSSGSPIVTHYTYEPVSEHFIGKRINGCWIEDDRAPGTQKNESISRKMYLISSDGVIVECVIDVTGVPLVVATGCTSGEEGDWVWKRALFDGKSNDWEMVKMDIQFTNVDMNHCIINGVGFTRQ